MSEDWYRNMFNNTNYECFERFKTDFEQFKLKPRKEHTKYLKEHNIQFKAQDALNINKLVFLRCGGKNTNLAKQKPGPNTGSKRTVKSTIDKKIKASEINFQQKQIPSIIKMNDFNRELLISYLEQKKIQISVDISDEMLIDLYVENIK